MKSRSQPPPFWKSISWRIQTWYALALALSIGGMMVGFQKSERQHRLDKLDAGLTKLIRPLVPRFQSAGRHRPPDNEMPGRRLPGEPLKGPQVESWIADNYWAVGWRSDGSTLLEEGTKTPSHVVFDEGSFEDEFRTSYGHRSMRMLAPARGILEIGIPLATFEDGLSKHAWHLAGTGAALFAGGMIIGWLIIHWGLRPVREIARTAAEISGGDLSRRIDASESSRELHELAVVLNHTFANLEAGIRQRERFTADASHELRTPLAVILGQVQQLLSKPRAESEYRDGLAVAEKAAQRMKSLVEELMVLARLDAETEVRREPADLAQLAQAVASEMRGLLAKRDVTLKTEFTPTPLSGDRDALVRVLTNLLGNAVHHNEPGVRITMRTWVENGYACATVRDDGKGIKPDCLPRVFDRFYRADPSRTNQRGGGNSGLGLAICKMIVEQHSGEIDVQSDLGKGSVFTIRIPC